MPHATPADLLARKSARLIGQLVADIARAGLEESQILTDARVLQSLEDASGMVDAALLAGKRYTAADLAGLTGNNLALLKRMVCEVAFALLYEIKPDTSRDSEAPRRAMDAARQQLERLRAGDEVFALEQQMDAGVMGSSSLTVVEQERSNTIRFNTRHYYPGRRCPPSYSED